MSAKPDSIKSILYTLFANLSSVVAKGFAAVWTGSGVMMTGLLRAINRVERDFRQAFPAVAWLFFEPDNLDGEAS